MIKNIIKDIKELNIEVVDYDDDSNVIICEKYNFDYKIVEFIEEKYDKNVGFYYKLDDDGFEIVELNITDDDFDKKVSEIVKEITDDVENKLSKMIKDDFQLEYYVRNGISRKLEYI